jgi:PmbA protein
MTTKEKYTLAEQVIEYALRKGAQQASVAIDDSRNNDIEIRNQQIDKLTESNRNSLNINLYVDKKYSSHSTNRLKKEELFRFVDEAIISTRFLAEDEFRMLPDPELYYKGGGSELMFLIPVLSHWMPKQKSILPARFMMRLLIKMKGLFPSVLFTPTV